MISVGDTVKVHYTGQLENGKVFDTTIGNEPITFTIGDEMMISGFETAVIGMKEGDKKTITIKAINAYGEYDDKLLIEVNKGGFLGDKQINKGDIVQVPTNDGLMEFIIHQIKDDKIILDGNSKLAGKDVIFDIEIIEVIRIEEEILDDFDDEFNDDSEFDIDDSEFDIDDSYDIENM